MSPPPFSDPAKFYFLFDFISHNAWLAWGESQKLAARFGLEFEPLPVVFGALLKAHGQLGPAEVPPKARWMMVNVLRKAQALKLPIAPPHSHPFNPLTALRLASCSLPRDERLRLIECLWRAAWTQGRELADDAVVAESLRDAGFDAQTLLTEARSEIVRNALRANTDAAIAHGVFGVPTMLVRGELFWGFDDLPFLGDFLENRNGLAPEIVEPWFAVRPSVQRSR